MERVILHVDANCFYASVECRYHPEWQGKPLAVCGNPEERHGIVLTASYPAKQMGVHVGQTIWQARQICPELIVAPPHYTLYMDFSHKMRRLWAQYTDQVEGFGLDESWLDLTGPGMTLEKGAQLADRMRGRMRAELGFSVSIGVADNKVFAKLGSDMKKPDGTTLLLPEEVPKKVWPLPVRLLLYAGPAACHRLTGLGVRTIGELARADEGMLFRALGKGGMMLQAFARGLDCAPVMGTEDTLKSVSNSVTLPQNIVTMEDAKCVYYLLAESVASRMRAQGLKTACVSVSARDETLRWTSCQAVLPHPTSLTSEIAQRGWQLFSAHLAKCLPLRSAGLSCAQLVEESAPEQLSFDQDFTKRIKLEKLERTVDALRSRYGSGILQRGVVMARPGLLALRSQEEEALPALPFFVG